MKFIRITQIFLFLSFSYFHPSYSQGSAKEEPEESDFSQRSYTTTAITGHSIKIDGIIEEDAWSFVDWTSDYVEFEPDNNTSPAEQTKNENSL